MRYVKLTEQEIDHIRAIAEILEADFIISRFGLDFVYDEPLEDHESILYCLSLYLLEHIKANYEDERITDIVSRANLKVEVSRLTTEQKTDFYELVQMCIYETKC
jgi:hypothetical protein